MARKRFVTAAVVLMAAQAVFVFAGGQQSSAKTGGSSSKTDLGGVKIVLGFDNKDRNYDTNTFVPTSAYGEKLLAYRRQIQKDYNFSFKEDTTYHWDYYFDQWQAAMVAGKPLSEIVYMYGGMILPYQKQGWLAPMPASIDFSKSANGLSWSREVARAMTWGGKTYGFTVNPGSSWRNKGLVFNKRLLRDAGIDPESIYDMQKAKTWTWAKYEELVKKLTRDVNNDGKIDVYGADQFQHAPFVCSNGGQYIDFDAATGTFVNATTRPEWAEAWNFANSLRPYAGGNFLQGTAAFGTIDEESINYEGSAYLTFADDWGWVVYPMGPRAKDYYVYARDDIYCIPSTFSASDVDKFMTALQLWMTPPQGAADGWKEDQYRWYRDERAVNETLPIMRNPNNCVFPIIYFTELNEWDMQGETAQQQIESVQAAWASKLAEYNAIVKK
ncbi:MAG: hypothetical protein LBG76_10070 [Treponema sp.]|jgi:hypothetical protein|nr:hypothetical protein [Treponema sp.]